jgi:predicted ATPase
MIRRVKIVGYKSLHFVELRLEPLVVLIGPNAAGKSNFIDALQLLSRLVCSRSLKEAFEPPYRGRPLESFAMPKGGLTTLLNEESASFTIEVDLDLSQQTIDAVNSQIAGMRRPPDGSKSNGLRNSHRSNYIHHQHLRYRVEIQITPRNGMLMVADEYLAPLDKEGNPKSQPQPFMELKGSRIHLRMEGQSHPTYMDQYLDHTIASRPHYPPHYPHLTALRQELESWWFYYFEPRERMRASTSVKEVRHIGLMGENLPAFLNTLRTQSPPQFNALNKALHNLIPSIKCVDTLVDQFGEVELLIKEGDIDMPARVVSEGTLRMLGLLALTGVKELPALIGFEEPENGVQPRRVRDVAKIIMSQATERGTQMVITTHSPLLAEHLPLESLLVCKKVDGRTEIKPLETWGALGKRQDVDEALDEPSETQKLSMLMLRGDLDA